MNLLQLSCNNLQTYQLVKNEQSETNWKKGKKSDLEKIKHKQSEKFSFDIYNRISVQVKRALEAEEEVNIILAIIALTATRVSRALFWLLNFPTI